MARKRALTGIQPSGVPHIGNLKGMIEPALQLQETHEPFYFIASYHALTSTKDATLLRDYQREAALSFLAFGLDPDVTSLFLQQDVPEVCELSWILGCHVNTGVLERAHAYKAARDAGREINAGTFNYPILMAADILIYDSHAVPVGKDQKQHVEMARDMAAGMNHRYGAEIFVLPEPLIKAEVATVPGLDGRKMSKSYGNTLPLFLPPKKLRKLVMKIVTDSKGVDEAKDPGSCNVFALYELFATADEQADLADRYRAGGLGYGHAKQALFEAMDRFLAEPRERYAELSADPEQVDRVLAQGAEKARGIAQHTMSRVRGAIGLGPAR
ncbi:MAG: tryptophan--tRNA ligase [Proteobacteria bacterium]|nr:tryptophan--tRNA ligase [Pseudomonadota bacterium]MCP4917891.1 tryptophan--tRNA ligase [Pseudomonadota bacterium]